MTVEILLAMQECAERSVAGSSTLRTLLREDPVNFLRSSILLLHHEPEAPGHEQLLKLLAGNDRVMEEICDPDFTNHEESVRLVVRLAKVEPHLDAKLA